MEILHTVVKERRVNSAKNLIKSFETMKKEAQEDACRQGFCLTQLNSDIHCDWKNLNEDGTEVLLQFKLEIYGNN